MRIAVLGLCCLLIGAAPAEVPVGKFETWMASKRQSLDFTSGGIRVHAQAAPCNDPRGKVTDSSCSWEGYNNQATVTIAGPGIAPVMVRTDDQSSYARIAVVRFDQADTRPGVIIESQYGGSGGIMTLQLLVPQADSYHLLSLDAHDGTYLEGQIADFPKDLSGDGRIDLKLWDSAFAYVFGCNACTPRPPILFAVKNDRIVDESRDPALRSVFADDMKRLKPICLSDRKDRNGACVAYVADAARAGEFADAWAEMLQHYEHGAPLWEPCKLPPTVLGDRPCPDAQVIHFQNFPDSLRAFLIHTGYLAADAAPRAAIKTGGG